MKLNNLDDPPKFPVWFDKRGKSDRRCNRSRRPGCTIHGTGRNNPESRIPQNKIALRNINQCEPSAARGDDTGMFVTMIYGVLDYKTREFQYVGAGHSLPLLLDALNNFVSLDQNVGQPLGLFLGISLDEQTISPPHKSLLLMYTDGITEAVNNNDEFYGIDQLQQVLKENRQNSASDICESVWRSLEDHLKDTPQQDDVTIMSMSVG